MNKHFILPSLERFTISDLSDIISNLCFLSKSFRVLNIKYLICPELFGSFGDNSIIGLAPINNNNLLPNEAIFGVDINNIPFGFNSL